MMKERRSGQSIFEYVFLVAVVVSALLIGQFYVQRAMTGRLKQSADQIGDQWDLQNSKFVVEVKSFRNSEEFVTTKGVSTSQLLADEEQSREITEFTINNPASTDSLF
jgi:hypothetical protein